MVAPVKESTSFWFSLNWFPHLWNQAAAFYTSPEGQLILYLLFTRSHSYHGARALSCQREFSYKPSKNCSWHSKSQTLIHRNSILKLLQSTYYFYENYSPQFSLQNFFSIQEINRTKTFTTKDFHSDSWAPSLNSTPPQFKEFFFNYSTPFLNLSCHTKIRIILTK